LVFCVSLMLGQSQEWQETPDARWRPLHVPTSGQTGFQLMPPAATGVRFTNSLAESSSALNRILQNGSGVAAGDVDGDGWCDLYFCQLEGDNVLYRNLGGWRFEEITDRAGVACPNQFSTGAAFADVDGDGDLDLLVNALGGGTRLFLNDGLGRFTELTGSRLNQRLGATSLALADIDDDGDLDLYVTNYRTTTYNDRPPGLRVEARRIGNRIVVTPEDRFLPLMERAGGVEILERGDRDYLYINDGTGRFLPVSWTTGSFLDASGQPLAAPYTDWGLSVLFRDLNQDRTPDIYVCNDFFYWPDRVWINEDSTRFRAQPPHMFRCFSVSSMGGDFADINRDGHDDLFVADMVSRKHSWRQRQRPNLMQGILAQPVEDPNSTPEIARNTLFLNRGDTTYTEIAQLAGVEFTEWSWGAVFLDVDLDGWEDLIVPTGNNHDVQDADALRAQQPLRQLADTVENRLRGWRMFPPLHTPILAYRNNRDLTFAEVGPQWGFTQPGPWQGLALADLDNDGDLDLVVNRLNNSAGLHQNLTIAPRLAVRLRGQTPNTRGVGARILVSGGPVAQSQEMIAGGRYLSDDDDLRVFAAFSPTQNLSVQVNWRSGRQTVVHNVPANSLLEVIEPDSPPPPPPARPSIPSLPWFVDVSHHLNHSSTNTAPDDFSHQPLLSRRLNNRGPGLTWFDIDQDGREDLLVGTDAGSPPRAFRNLGPQGFVPFNLPELDPQITAGTLTILAYRANNQTRLALAIPLVHPSQTNAGFMQFTLPAPSPHRPDLRLAPRPAGPIAVADVDGSGRLDVFIAGRPLPGRYPEASPSVLLRTPPNATSSPDPHLPHQCDVITLPDLGVVNSALFADLTSDGLPELVVATDWGPIHILLNHQGQLAPWDPPVIQPSSTNQTPIPLSQLTGWWNSIAAGDFDGDGHLDLVAANWGRNTRFQRHLAKPLRLYYADFNNSSHLDLLDTVFEPELGGYVPWRDFETIARALPFILEHAQSFRTYGESTLETLLGSRFTHARFLEAVTLDSVVLLNRHNHFVLHPLPIEAQSAPAFGTAIADFDGDGHLDLFLAQNFFGVEPETSRYDAGRGLLLRGNGQGHFDAVPGQLSGIMLYGEQRACAVADYDQDGRVDLVVGQQRGPTRLYRNQTASPGLRVTLQGPSGNPNAIGAAVRLRTHDLLGPAHEIRAGTGWHSQDSTTLILPRPTSTAQLLVRWPGGTSTQITVPAHATTLVVPPPTGPQIPAQ
jgi:enediyne biosynthesis protein E4